MLPDFLIEIVVFDKVVHLLGNHFHVLIAEYCNLCIAQSCLFEVIATEGHDCKPFVPISHLSNPFWISNTATIFQGATKTSFASEASWSNTSTESVTSRQ